MVKPGPLQDHLRIRDVADGDLDLLFAHQLDPEATRMAVFPPRQRDAFMAHWARIRADQTVFSQSVVIGEQVVGYVVSWDQSGRRAVGYWIGRAWWGRGMATEALALFLRRMSVRPLYAYVGVHNVGSIRVLEKCGFGPVARRDVVASEADDDGVEQVVLVLES
jgi:RimJ/RimL family protein N-acetyltransferase